MKSVGCLDLVNLNEDDSKFVERALEGIIYYVGFNRDSSEDYMITLQISKDMRNWFAVCPVSDKKTLQSINYQPTCKVIRTTSVGTSEVQFEDRTFCFYPTKQLKQEWDRRNTPSLHK